MKNMVKRFALFIIICQLFITHAFSRNDTIRLGQSFGMQISGFARIDYIYDSRQTSEAVDGLFTFFPLEKELDAEGNDINASPRANFLSIATRFGTRFFAPDILGAKSFAYVEFDFTGSSNTNGVRLRHAYFNLAWPKSNLLIGRTWHPLASECVPGIVGFNTGAPFWAFNRSDQVRFDFKPGQWILSAIAAYQCDYASIGPSPVSGLPVKSSSYLRDAVWPEFDISVAYKTTSFKAGVVGGVKTLKPRLYTQVNGMKYKTSEKLTTFTAQAYAQYKVSDWVFKAQSTYAQNMTESLMVGGYAVSLFDAVTGHEEYTPTQYMNYWASVDYGKKLQAGVFVGYLNSLGTLDNVVGDWYARAPNLKYMYRISPHLFYNINNWQFAVELECSAAAYGDIEKDNKAKIVNTEEVVNIRTNFMFSFYF